MLNKFAAPIPLDNGVPRWLDFLGGVIGDRDVSGQAPEYCGNTATSPFTISDLDINVAPFTIDYGRKVISAGKAKGTLDIVAAVRATGVSQKATLDKVAASVSAAWDRAAARATTGRSDYVVVMLKNQIINELQSDNPRPGLAACVAQLKSHPELRLIRAISGYLVKFNSTTSNVNSDLSASITAAIKTSLPTVDIASITASVTRTVSSNVKLMSGPRFFAIAATFHNL